MIYLFSFSFLCILTCWLFYPLTLALLSKFFKNRTNAIKPMASKPISIILAVHNEADKLHERVNNIYSCDYPTQLIEVIIASDGSTDNTVEKYSELKMLYPQVKYIESKTHNGRANIHNKAIEHCSSEYVFFTDAETLFAKNYITEILKNFSDNEVGYVSGVISHLNSESNSLTQSASMYWKFEYALRMLEMKLGVYMFGSGPCCAIKKSLFKAIPLSGDVEYITAIDVILQKHTCAIASDAIVYDQIPDTASKEFRSRIRKTSKCLPNIIKRWGWRNIFKHPILSFAILCHRVLRYFTPYFMIIFFVSNLFILQDASMFIALFTLQLTLYFLAILGYYKLPIYLSSASYSFCIANLGFFFGVIKALRGQSKPTYTPVRKL